MEHQWFSFYVFCGLVIVIPLYLSPGLYASSSNSRLPTPEINSNEPGDSYSSSINPYNFDLSQPIFPPAASFESRTQRKWEYCLPPSSSKGEPSPTYECDKLDDEDQSEDDYFDFLKLTDSGRPYFVKFNTDLMSISDAVTSCKFRAVDVCQHAFNTTNPNKHARQGQIARSPQMKYILLMSLALATSFMLAFCLYKHKQHELDGDASGSRYKSKASRLFDKMANEMLSREIKQAQISLNARTLRFYDDEMENQYRRISHKRHWKRCAAFLIGFLAYIFLLGYNNEGPSDWISRGSLTLLMVLSFAQIAAAFHYDLDILSDYSISNLVLVTPVLYFVAVYLDAMNGNNFDDTSCLSVTMLYILFIYFLNGINWRRKR